LVFGIRINQQIHIYKQVQSHFSIIHQPASLNHRTP